MQTIDAGYLLKLCLDVQNDPVRYAEFLLGAYPGESLLDYVWRVEIAGDEQR